VTRGDGAPDFELRQKGNKCAADIFRRKPVVVGTASGILAEGIVIREGINHLCKK
jgi:hypothetical protein